MKISVQREEGFVVITGTSEAERKQVKIAAPVFQAVSELSEPTPNGEVQTRLAEAMGVPAPGGRSGKAASFIERFTFGYGAFNGWCSLLIATQDGRKRLFQFNPEFVVTGSEKPEMLTKKEKSGSTVQKISVNEDLDIPDNYAMSDDDVNEVIERAYTLLGFNPYRLTEDAPDLTLEDATRIVMERGA